MTATNDAIQKRGFVLLYDVDITHESLLNFPITLENKLL